MEGFFARLGTRIRAALARLRVFLAVRLGLARGAWRRGQVVVPAARLLPTVFANDSWRYGLYCPPALADDTAAPLVLLLHGCRQRALGFAQASGWVRAADRHRFRLLCPQQRTRANLWRCWNWFTPAAQRGAGELALMRALLAQVRTQVAVRDRAVVVVGLSAGGAMAALLAFHAADVVDAAVAVAAPPLLGRVSAQDPRDVMARGLAVAPALALSGSAPVAPLLLVQGESDTVVAPLCSEQLVEQARQAHARNGQPLVERAPTAAHDLQAGDAVLQGVTTRTWGTADDPQPRLRLLRVAALAHAWSGAPGGHPYVEADGADLTRLALRFLGDRGLL